MVMINAYACASETVRVYNLQKAQSSFVNQWKCSTSSLITALKIQKYKNTKMQKYNKFKYKNTKYKKIKILGQSVEM